MFRRLVLVLLALSLIIPAYADAAVRVRGHFRKNGTYVAPHYRSNPDGIRSNNWSTRGNVNPYTGAIGTKNPSVSIPPAFPVTRDWSRELFGTPSAAPAGASASSFQERPQAWRPSPGREPLPLPPLWPLYGGESRTRTREICSQRARLAQIFAEGRDLGLSATEQLNTLNLPQYHQTVQDHAVRLIVAVYAAPQIDPSEVVQIVGTSCFKALGVE